MLKHFSFARFLLIEGCEQGALRKELIVAPFEERFKTDTLRKHLSEILLVLGAIYLNIVFLSNFC